MISFLQRDLEEMESKSVKMIAQPFFPFKCHAEPVEPYTDSRNKIYCRK